MNTLLAFKPEPDLSMLAEADWQALAAGDDAVLSRVRYQLAGDEQAAAEILLRQRDLNPALALRAWTLADAPALPLLRQLAGCGFTHLSQVTPPPEGEANVAAELAREVCAEKITLVVTGSQSSGRGSRLTPHRLALLLGWPCIGGGRDFTLDPDNQTVRVRQGEGGQQRELLLRLPLVLAVSHGGDYLLRVPGLRAKMAAGKQAVAQRPAAAAVREEGSLLQLTRRRAARAGVIIEGDSPAERVRRLWDHYLQPRWRT